NDLLAAAFPQVLACPETLPGGPIEVPMEHPVVRQTIEDCLTEAMDVDGFLEVLWGLRDGRIAKRAVDTPEPSAFARGILNSAPAPPTSWALSMPTPSPACARRRGRSRRAPKRCTRRCCGSVT